MPPADPQLWQRLVLLAVAGAAGTLARYGLHTLVHRFVSTEFPWGTLLVNAVGCLLFGLVWALAEERVLVSAATRLILLAGFMGAFTTFSSFAFETGYLLHQSKYLLAAGNLLVQNTLGIALVFAGIALGRMF